MIRHDVTLRGEEEEQEKRRMKGEKKRLKEKERADGDWRRRGSKMLKEEE